MFMADHCDELLEKRGCDYGIMKALTVSWVLQVLLASCFDEAEFISLKSLEGTIQFNLERSFWLILKLIIFYNIGLKLEGSVSL